MGDSNGAWGELARYDDELAEAFDRYERLPERGDNAALDAFCDRKNITISQLVRLGARLAEYDVLAFAFPGGIKYRDVVTDKRWSAAGSTFRELKIVRAGAERASIAIVAEGESDSARLTGLYPEADIAVLPAGADPRPHTQAYAQQLNGYELVLLAQDDDDAGHAGAAMLAEHLTAKTLRWVAPDSEDWAAVNGNAPPLPDPAVIDADKIRVGGLVFENLTDILAGNLQPPEMMIDDLLYAEGVHWLSGHPASGKTTLAMHAAWLAMCEDRHVVWLDYEGGLRQTVRRLNDIGIPHEMLVERFHYAGWPTDAPKYFDDVAARWPDAFIVVDSASKSLTLAGLDENSPGDVTQWVGPIVKACKAHALPVAIIDHVTKNAASTARYSRGAGSKLADADVAWYIEATEPFNRDRAGLMHCRLQKDREGCLPFDVWYKVGDGRGGLMLEPTTAPDEPLPGAEAPAI